ncbi:hypothetical protein V6Z12_D07G173300 [Gossypium hirsutum]
MATTRRVRRKGACLEACARFAAGGAICGVQGGLLGVGAART